MPYKAQWLVPNHVFYISIYGIVTSNDLENILSDTETYLQTADTDRLIHQIVDSTDIEKLAIGISDIKRVFSNVKPHPLRGWTVTVTPSAMLRFFGTLATQFSKIRDRQVSTLDEAILFLTESDDQLPSQQELVAKVNQLLQTA